MKQFILLLSLLLLVSAFDENALDVVKQKVSEKLDRLPASIKDDIPLDLVMNEIPHVEEGEELLRERCDRYGTNESFANVMDAKEEIQECFRHFVNYSQIKQEIELAKPTGNLDVVFRKYCRRSHQFRDCVTNFTETLEPCLSPDERGSKQTFIDMLDSLIKFVCFKEGRHIALFIAEGGPECLMSNEEKIQECLNSTFSHYIPQEATDNQNDLPQFRLGQTECGDVTKAQQCIVGHLEKCTDPTPANIVNSLMSYVRKVTPCHQYERSTSRAGLTTVNSVLAFVAAALLLTKFH
ncbi:27 kDa hemolymph protein-like isoform X1 [Homalodisca vitripennis]|nr:27 kDa hemolymph protein-like isoform X1 [Homalodisca vitripennis]